MTRGGRYLGPMLALGSTSLLLFFLFSTWPSFVNAAERFSDIPPESFSLSHLETYAQGSHSKDDTSTGREAIAPAPEESRTRETVFKPSIAAGKNTTSFEVHKSALASSASFQVPPPLWCGSLTLPTTKLLDTPVSLPDFAAVTQPLCQDWLTPADAQGLKQFQLKARHVCSLRASRHLPGKSGAQLLQSIRPPGSLIHTVLIDPRDDVQDGKNAQRATFKHRQVIAQGSYGVVTIAQLQPDGGLPATTKEDPNCKEGSAEQKTSLTAQTPAYVEQSTLKHRHSLRTEPSEALTGVRTAFERVIRERVGAMRIQQQHTISESEVMHAVLQKEKAPLPVRAGNVHADLQDPTRESKLPQQKTGPPALASAVVQLVASKLLRSPCSKASTVAKTTFGRDVQRRVAAMKIGQPHAPREPAALRAALHMKKIVLSPGDSFTATASGVKNLVDSSREYNTSRSKRSGSSSVSSSSATLDLQAGDVGARKLGAFGAGDASQATSASSTTTAAGIESSGIHAAHHDQGLERDLCEVPAMGSTTGRVFALKFLIVNTGALPFAPKQREQAALKMVAEQFESTKRMIDVMPSGFSVNNLNKFGFVLPIAVGRIEAMNSLLAESYSSSIHLLNFVQVMDPQLTDLFETRIQEPTAIQYAFKRLIQLGAHLAAAGLVHMDIKQENIGVATSGELTLLDFDAARREGEGFLCSAKPTLSFAPPEIAKEVLRGFFDERSQPMCTATLALDAWNLGIVLLERVCPRSHFFSCYSHEASLRAKLTCIASLSPSPVHSLAAHEESLTSEAPLSATSAPIFWDSCNPSPEQRQIISGLLDLVPEKRLNPLKIFAYSRLFWQPIPFQKT